MESKKHIFTLLEKKCFLEIIKKHNSVIENKETDGASLLRKTEAWKQVTAEFNASPQTSSQATTKQLRRLWMNLKQRQREALTKERQYRLATGGGTSINDVIIDPDVAQAAPALIVGINTAIDSDSVVEIIETPTYVEDIHGVQSLEVQPTVNVGCTSNDCPDIPPASQAHHLRTPPTLTGQRLKDYILEAEFKERQIRANEKHKLELLLLHEQIRESKGKADLVEFILEKKKQQSVPDLPSVPCFCNFDK